MGKRRIVVTGIGAVSPLGCGIQYVWKQLINGKCGISAVTEGTLQTKVYGRVPVGSEEHEFNPTRIFGRDISKDHSNFIQYAMYASDLAIQNANLKDFDQDRAGVALASGGLGSIEDVVASSRNLDTSYKKLSPYFVPKVLGNMAAGHVSIRQKFRGPLHSAATACAAGSHAIGDACKSHCSCYYFDDSIVFGFVR